MIESHPLADGTSSRLILISEPYLSTEKCTNMKTTLSEVPTEYWGYFVKNTSAADSSQVVELCVRYAQLPPALTSAIDASVGTSEPILLGAFDKVRKSRELLVGLRQTDGFHNTNRKGIDDRLLAGIAG